MLSIRRYHVINGMTFIFVNIKMKLTFLFTLYIIAVHKNRIVSFSQLQCHGSTCFAFSRCVEKVPRGFNDHTVGDITC